MEEGDSRGYPRGRQGLGRNCCTMFKTLEFVLQMMRTMNRFEQGNEMTRLTF